MELEHRFVVPVPVAQAWEVLLDVERIAPCMPGATVESFDGETVTGRVKVKVGPIQVTYAGTAKFTEKDVSARRAVIEADAKEARGAGTAAATITAVLAADGAEATAVTVSTDLAITGRPAQFGRGVMVEVGNKLLGRFADCLADELGGRATGADLPIAEEAASAVAAATTQDPALQARPAPEPTPLRRADTDDAIDLLDAAGVPVLKRLAPAIAVVLLLLVVRRLLARRR